MCYHGSKSGLLYFGCAHAIESSSLPSAALLWAIHFSTTTFAIIAYETIDKNGDTVNEFLLWV